MKEKTLKEFAEQDSDNITFYVDHNPDDYEIQIKNGGYHLVLKKDNKLRGENMTTEKQIVNQYLKDKSENFSTIRLNDEISGGKPTFEGRRLTVSTILMSLFENMNMHSYFRIGNEWSVTIDQIQEAVEYAMCVLDDKERDEV